MPEQRPLIFRKSSYSSGKGQNCVEVADTGAGAAVRDNQNRELGHIDFGSAEWRAFLADVKSGRL
ncbi:DUF397 domain-containing protein [Allosalinactinospora lopnorensis]|uniref:DUF397 domain-containing protein n=1 Tax=Allosalinactinospora lopnorensis TaxID=1352348 RepID=UPI000623D0D8|nr:DUF397 domain-containing protein [Allosalinactinospora lopnorensis]